MMLVLELDGYEHANCRVPAMAVVEDRCPASPAALTRFLPRAGMSASYADQAIGR
jgi:hypothetical protein